MNEIFKSELALKQELNGTKRVKTLYSNIGNGMRMDVSIRRMDMSIRNGCARSDRMDVFVWGQPVGRMDVSVWRMDVSVRNGCTRSN